MKISGEQNEEWFKDDKIAFICSSAIMKSGKRASIRRLGLKFILHGAATFAAVLINKRDVTRTIKRKI
jgi:hypothetical protein